MTDEAKKLLERLRGLETYGYQSQLAWEAAAHIEALEAENERLRGVVDALLQHDASSFWGADAEKNRRASLRGVIRKAKKVRAALEG